MKKLIYMGALALIAAGGIFWSCQKDEFIIPEEGMTLKSSSKTEVKAELTVSPGTTVCINTPVTLSMKAWITETEEASSGKASIEELISGVWVKIADFVDLPSHVSYTFTPEEETVRTFRVHYVGGANYTNSDDQKTVTAEICGCTYEGNLLTGKAISCDETREAIYTFSSQYGSGPFKIQGGLSNFTGEEAVVYINGELVIFSEISLDEWNQGTTEDGFVVGQRTPGNSSNRNIRVEGSLGECSEVVIRIMWNSTNSGSIITGEWTVVGEDVGEVIPVGGLTCSE